MPTRLALLLAAACSCAGCFQSTTIVHVKGDGSGTIEQTTLFTDAAIGQMRALNAGNGASADPLSEAAARSAASALGPGVSLVASTPVSENGAQGRRSVYTFTDISQIRLSQDPSMPGRPAGGVDTGGNRLTFALRPQADGNVLLVITFPEPKLAPGAGTGAPGDPAAVAAQTAMAKQMFAGARLLLAVEPDGRVVRTTSPYVDAGRVTLVALDFDQIMTNDAAIAQLQRVKSVEDAKVALKDLKGLKATLDREVTILFSPAQ